MIKSIFVKVFQYYGQKNAGQPSVRGCYEPKVPENLKEVYKKQIEMAYHHDVMEN